MFIKDETICSDWMGIKERMRIRSCNTKLLVAVLDVLDHRSPALIYSIYPVHDGYQVKILRIVLMKHSSHWPGSGSPSRHQAILRQQTQAVFVLESYGLCTARSNFEVRSAALLHPRGCRYDGDLWESDLSFPKSSGPAVLVT